MWTDELLYLLSMFAQIVLFAMGLYYFVISLAAWIKLKEPNANEFEVKTKFALIVAAHNEEMVVGNVVDSLMKMDYPKELYDVFVIADNCSDKTGDIAEEHGANVFRRFNTTEKGKGYALKYCFDKIFEMEKKYDAFGIFDADNLVAPNFLLEMNKQFVKGKKAVQGYIDSKNPFDSWISASYSIAFWTANRLFQLPRYYLGFTCGLSGTGFCISTEIIKKYGWNATCLTEDLEYTMMLVLDNEKVSWCHNAIVYDEKPIGLIQSWKQRKRWAQGYVDCAKRFFGPLMKKAIKEKNIYAFDGAMQMLQPIRILVLGVAMILSYLPYLLPASKLFSMGYIIPNYIWNAIVVSQIIYGPLIIASEKRFNWNVLISYLIFYPIYNLTWIPITIQGIIDSDKKEWSHTAHTRAININDMPDINSSK